MLTRKSAKTLILGSGAAKRKILNMIAKEKLPKQNSDNGGGLSKDQRLRIKKKLDNLDSAKEKLVSKLLNKKLNSKTKKMIGSKAIAKKSSTKMFKKKSKTLNLKGSTAAVSKSLKGAGKKGNKKQGKHQHTSADALDKEL